MPSNHTSNYVYYSEIDKEKSNIIISFPLLLRHNQDKFKYTAMKKFRLCLYVYLMFLRPRVVTPAWCFHPSLIFLPFLVFAQMPPGFATLFSNHTHPSNCSHTSSCLQACRLVLVLLLLTSCMPPDFTTPLGVHTPLVSYTNSSYTFPPLFLCLLLTAYFLVYAILHLHACILVFARMPPRVRTSIDDYTSWCLDKYLLVFVRSLVFSHVIS